MSKEIPRASIYIYDKIKAPILNTIVTNRNRNKIVVTSGAAIILRLELIIEQSITRRFN